MNTNKSIYQEIFSNYNVFYNITLAVAMQGTKNSIQFDEDAEKIIDFLGNAFELEDRFIDGCKNLILGDMMKIGLVSDYHALAGVDELGEYESDLICLFEIKGRAIEEVNRAESKHYLFSNFRQNQNQRTNMKYELFHHEYEPHIKLNFLEQQAEYGDVLSTRQLGILYALGIGCEKNLNRSAELLERCVYWADTASVKILSYIKALLGEKDQAEKLLWVYRLVLGEKQEVKKEISEFYTLIKLIKRTIVIPMKLSEIDVAFVDVIRKPNIKHDDKLFYVLQYREQYWKNQLVKCTANKKIGLIG